LISDVPPARGKDMNEALLLSKKMVQPTHRKKDGRIEQKGQCCDGENRN
jgi:hypothetical protein